MKMKYCRRRERCPKPDFTPRNTCQDLHPLDYHPAVLCVVDPVHERLNGEPRGALAQIHASIIFERPNSKGCGLAVMMLKEAVPSIMAVKILPVGAGDRCPSPMCSCRNSAAPRIRHGSAGAVRKRTPVRAAETGNRQRRRNARCGGSEAIRTEVPCIRRRGPVQRLLHRPSFSQGGYLRAPKTLAPVVGFERHGTPAIGTGASGCLGCSRRLCLRANCPANASNALDNFPSWP